MSEQSNSTNETLPDFIKPYQNIFYKGNLYCHTCDVYVNSQAQLSSHNKTLKHLNLEKNDKNDKILKITPTSNKSPDRSKITIKPEHFECTLCQVLLNSRVQMEQHLQSKRHRCLLFEISSRQNWVVYADNCEPCNYYVFV